MRQQHQQNLDEIISGSNVKGSSLATDMVNIYILLPQ